MLRRSDLAIATYQKLALEYGPWLLVRQFTHSIALQCTYKEMAKTPPTAPILTSSPSRPYCASIPLVPCNMLTTIPVAATLNVVGNVSATSKAYSSISEVLTINIANTTHLPISSKESLDKAKVEHNPTAHVHTISPDQSLRA